MSIPITIQIDVAAEPAGTPGVSRQELFAVVGQLVTCTDPANFFGGGAWQWYLTSPFGSAAVMAGDTASTMTFTIDIPGTYLVFVDYDDSTKVESWVNGADGDKISSQGGLEVEQQFGNKLPVVGESLQFGQWGDKIDEILRPLDSAIIGAGDPDAIHDNVPGEIAIITEKATPIAADFVLIEDSAALNAKKRAQVGNLPATPHDIGGASHVASTLAQINTKVSDATLDGAGDTRPPSSHALAGANHSTSTLAQLNTKVSDATLDDSGDPRTPSSHGLGGSEHATATLAQLNAKVSDATLIDTTDPRLSDARTPTSHGLGGSEHATATLAQLNAKVSDATLAALGEVQAYTKQQHATPLALIDAAVVLIDAEARNVFTLLATGGVGATRELDNPTNLVTGMTWQVWFTQDGTGGRALTYDTFYDFGDEGAPDHTTDTANKYSIITCVAKSPTKIATTVLKGFTS